MTTEVDRLVQGVVERLSDPGRSVRPSDFPGDAQDADRPGLYAWWADRESLSVLGVALGAELPPLIYAGQAGATSVRSATERSATLRSRIGGNHLRGNISSSTFRRTLTAILREPLGLQLDKRGRLDADANRAVSAWMRHHLRVAIAPVDDRSTLAAIELAVLQQLDPPLNLMGMRPSPVRTRLRELRSLLGASSSRQRKDEAADSLPPPPTAQTAGAVAITLHEAMAEVLSGGEWSTFDRVAEEIEARDLYRRRDGGFAGPGQLRMRATLSGGRYAHLFEVDGKRIRLRPFRPGGAGG